MNKDIDKTKAIIISLFLGIFVWVVDAILDSLMFYEGTFIEMLILKIPEHEIYIRLFIMFCFIIFGIITGNNLNKERIINKDLQNVNQQLIASKKSLRDSEKKLQANNQQLQASEQMLKKQTHKLNERIKELNCFYSISETVRTRETMEEILQDVTEIIPPSWQYPQITCSKITLWDKEYKTENYKDSQWKLSSDIRVNQKIAGKIEVCYLEKKTESDIGPFLNEERILLDDIAERLGRIVEKKNAEKALEATNQQLRAANQQLDANFQQLQATEQQLRAGNQQLDAHVQQLQATEQQLRAANQQLTASEEKFKSYIQNAPDGIFIVNEKGKYIEVNMAACEITGYSEDELLNLTMPELIQEEYTEKALSHFQTVSKDGSARDEVGFVTKSGEKRFWSVGAVKLSETRFLEFAKDITDRKQAEKELAKLSTAVTQSPSVIAITDTKGNLQYVNPKFTEITGYNLEEAIGQNPRILKSGEQSDEIYKELWKTISSGNTWRGEFHNKKKNGELFWEMASISPIFNEQGKIVNYLKVAEDITKKKNTEQELIKTKTKAEVSEKKFKAAFQTSPDSVNINKLNGEYVEINEGFTRLTGYTKKDVIGKLSSEIDIWSIPSDREKLVAGLQNDGIVENLESLFRAKDGTLIPALMSAKIIYLKGEPHILSVTRAIVDRKRMEQELIEAKEETLLKNRISNAIILADDDEFYKSILDIILESLHCTFGYFGYMDYSKEEKLICPSMTYDIWDECQMPDKTIEFPKSIWAGIWGESLKTKKSIYKNSDLKLPAGHVQLENALAVPIIYKRKLLGQIVVGNNGEGFGDSHKKSLEELCNYISPLLHSKLMEKKYQSRLIKTKEKAEESDRLKTAFLNNMSHEIRTPLNGITGFIGLLQDSEIDDEEKQHYFDIINKSSDRLIATVTDIMDISRIEAKLVNVSKTEVSVNDILEEQYNFFYHQAKLKGLELIYKPNLSDKEARFVTDKHKLEGILTNLIKNAIKFTEQGEITFACSRKKKQDIDVLEFYVKDTGIGIPTNRIEAIFNRFEQADIEDTRVYEGSGLGLAISKSYVEMLGGEISVSSKEGSGSTFTFSIPYTKQFVKESDDKENINKEPQTSLSNLSVIIAEDDETSIRYFKAIFKNLFSKITYTKTGKETIDKCRENPETNIILMDIKMPDMNGYDATREIRKFNSNVVIIAQTAFGLTGDKQKAIDAGCNDYIAKPIKKEILFEKIRACVNHERDIP